MKTKEDFLERGEGNFIHCADYESAIEAMQSYADQEVKAAIEKRDEQIRDWIISCAYEDSDIYFITIDELNKLLSTPADKTEEL
jgi:hypothetical protein